MGNIGKTVGAAFAGAALAQGLSAALDLTAATAKLKAQLGLTQVESQRIGSVAGKLYAGAYGESMSEVNDAISSVVQNMDGLRGASSAALQETTARAITVGQVLGEDVGAVTTSVSQIMRTGLAKSSKEAFDIITFGAQHGAHSSQDLLDTFKEYGTQFRKLGLDGQTALGLIQQGLQGGARDSDLVADSIKEFSIRAVDGSKLTSQGFKSLGLDAKAMAEQIGGGGKGASIGLQSVLDKLRGIKDPIKQAQIATSLFGTQAEDMGKALFSLNPSTAISSLGKLAGATDAAGKALGETPQAKFTAFKRGLELNLTTFISEKVIPVLSWFGSALGTAFGFLSSSGTGASILRGALLGAVTAIVLVTAATKLWSIYQTVLNVAMDANPIGLIVIAIAALVGAVILAYQHSKTFRDIVQGAWSGIQAAATAAWAFLKPIFQGIYTFVTVNMIPVWSLFAAYFKLVWKVVSTELKIAWIVIQIIFKAIVFYVTNFIIPGFKLLWSAVKLIWSGIKVAISVAWAAIKIIWKAIQVYIDVLKFAFQVWWALIKFVWGGIRIAISAAWNFIKPIFTAIKNTLATVLGPAFSAIKTVISVVWGAIKLAISSAWSSIKVTFNALKTGVNAIKTAFSIAMDAIKSIWNGLKAATKAPVSFVVNTVYMNGIRRVWEGVRGVVPGLPALPSVKFAAGGIFPGYSPGYDNLAVPMAAFSGGEGVLRPEVTKAIGPRFIYGSNKAAMSGGVGGVLKFLGGFGDPGGTGIPGYATGGIVQRFSGGGILGSIKNVLSKPVNIVKHLGSTIISKGVDFFAKQILDPITNQIPHGGAPWMSALSYMPEQMIKGFLNFIKTTVSPKIFGGASSVVSAARKWLGTPYSWGGGGPAGPSYGIAQGAHTLGFDCSGLTENAWWNGDHIDIGGTTVPQWSNSSPIGGPKAGALAFPSGPGVHVMLGSDKPGYVIQAPHTGAYVEEVKRSSGNWRWPKSAKFDSGGFLERGIFNGTSDPEPVLTGQQWSDIHTLASRGSQPQQIGPFNVTGLPTMPSEKQITNAVDRALTLNGKW
jgi:phage-related minor tail protein